MWLLNLAAQIQNFPIITESPVGRTELEGKAGQERENGRGQPRAGAQAAFVGKYGDESLDEGSRVGEEERQLDPTPRPLPLILILWTSEQLIGWGGARTKAGGREWDAGGPASLLAEVRSLICQSCLSSFGGAEVCLASFTPLRRQLAVSCPLFRAGEPADGLQGHHLPN